MDSSKIMMSIRIPLSNATVHEVPSARTVQELRALAAKETARDPDTLNLIYRGLVLRDGNDLSHYGLQCGGMVHVLSKKRSNQMGVGIALSDEEANQIASALKSASGGIRSALARMNRTESIANVTAAIPALKEDPVAVAILKDPDLLMHMADPEVVKKVSKAHPLLAEAAKHLAAELAEQGRSSEAGNEDMETEDSPRQQRPITGNQLAAALASAISGVTRSRPTPQRLFTPEMLNSALQQAFQSVPSLTTSPAAPSAAGPSSSTTTATTTPERLTQQLQQMRELGLLDEALNRQMLEITNGDVQAAIDLVMGSQLN